MQLGPIELTETGWDSAKVGETGQARGYLETFHLSGFKGFLSGLDFYELEDDPRITRDWGIIDHAGRRKLAWYVTSAHLAG